mmetsp:Transcript_1847/g.4267  ORF Transcript_1847/g.4267 Transcript_1847/m.4267 type:complete len:242 (-) Transcript_1847:233-958(-)|eukprot:g1791.t1
MSVFLGGKWRELELQNATLQKELQHVEEELAHTQDALAGVQRNEDKIVMERNQWRHAAETAADDAKQVKQIVGKLRGELAELLLAYDRRSMRMEDLERENAWLRTKKDLGNTKLSVLKEARDTLGRKLKIAEHKLGTLAEDKKEDKAKIYSLETEARALATAVGKKDMLIRSLQKEKTSMFQELTKLRAQTPLNAEGLQRENAKLLRELRQLKCDGMATRPATADVYGGRGGGSNPWTSTG